LFGFDEFFAFPPSLSHSLRLPARLMRFKILLFFFTPPPNILILTSLGFFFFDYCTSQMTPAQRPSLVIHNLNQGSSLVGRGFFLSLSRARASRFADHDSVRWCLFSFPFFCCDRIERIYVTPVWFFSRFIPETRNSLYSYLLCPDLTIVELFSGSVSSILAALIFRSSVLMAQCLKCSPPTSLPPFQDRLFLPPWIYGPFVFRMLRSFFSLFSTNTSSKFLNRNSILNSPLSGHDLPPVPILLLLLNFYPGPCEFILPLPPVANMFCAQSAAPFIFFLYLLCFSSSLCPEGPPPSAVWLLDLSKRTISSLAAQVPLFPPR